MDDKERKALETVLLGLQESVFRIEEVLVPEANDRLNFRVYQIKRGQYFQNGCARHWRGTGSVEERIDQVASGLSEVSSQFDNITKGLLVHGLDDDGRDGLVEMCGGVLYHTAVLLQLLDVTIPDCMAENEDSRKGD